MIPAEIKWVLGSLFIKQQQVQKVKIGVMKCGYMIMPESEKTIDLDRRFAVLEERMNTITESYDRGWKLREARIGRDLAGMREDNARRDAEFAKLREDIAKRDTVNTRWLIAVITAATAIIIGVVLSTS